MIKRSFKKNKISIQNIGCQRFWFGIIAGLISAISISLIFNQTREVFRFFTGLSDQSKQWCAMVSRIDGHFGNLLAALEEDSGE